jgi:hypothetical protein
MPERSRNRATAVLRPLAVALTVGFIVRAILSFTHGRWISGLLDVCGAVVYAFVLFTLKRQRSARNRNA